MRQKDMNNNAQMMVLESILFSITVVLALYFIVQLSPTSVENSIDTTNDLQILGDNALHSLYNEQGSIIFRGGKFDFNSKIVTNNPTSKIVVCIICNNFNELKTSLNDYLPDNINYNLYIRNATKIKFLCNSDTSGTFTGPLPKNEPVVISHFLISIDPIHLTNFTNEEPKNIYGSSSESMIQNTFNDYEQATYDIILELWSF